MKDNSILKKFEKQYYDFQNIINKDRLFKIGTLGPNGTSSENALKYLINNIKNDYNEFEICLVNDFYQVYELLEKDKLDFALVPSAYENICDFFWNYNFENTFNFIYETPMYGMISKMDYYLDNTKKIKIACCPAVENMMYSLSNGVLQKDMVEIVKTASTTGAVLKVLKSDAEIAIANQTSFDLYKNNGLKFISKKYNTEIVWSLFKNKTQSNKDSI